MDIGGQPETDKTLLFVHGFWLLVKLNYKNMVHRLPLFAALPMIYKDANGLMKLCTNTLNNHLLVNMDTLPPSFISQIQSNRSILVQGGMTDYGLWRSIFKNIRRMQYGDLQGLSSIYSPFHLSL
ncbi:unnamed protein product [Absidia cylindrospora]